MADQSPSDILDRLRNSPYPEIRRLRLKVVGGKIVLTGSVTTYYMKQIAQETIRSGNHGCVIVNKVDVPGIP